jgi:TonB family protein
MNNDLDLLLERFEDERSTHRSREAFLGSVILHLLLILFIIVGPKIFRSENVRDSHRINHRDTLQLASLALPKDYQQLTRKPSQPVVPLSKGSEPLKVPQAARKRPSSSAEASTKPVESPPAKATPQIAQSPTPVTSTVQQSLPPSAEAKQTSELPPAQISHASEEVRKPSLKELMEGMEAPGVSIDRSILTARQSGSYGSRGSGGDGLKTFDNRQPNFSVEEPAVLSETHGVDFGGWLRLVYFRVRDNWYSVIPEVIRSGMKGKVVVVFDVRSNGRIENLQVVRSSGLSPYDRAAESSLKLSEPFPAFPSAFKGDFITLQFSYLYNVRL